MVCCVKGSVHCGGEGVGVGVSGGLSHYVHSQEEEEEEREEEDGEEGMGGGEL